jgi:hypothetical protein
VARTNPRKIDVFHILGDIIGGVIGGIISLERLDDYSN